MMNQHGAMRLLWKQSACESGRYASGFMELELPLLPWFYNVTFWLFRNAADAEDLVRKLFLKALRGFDTFELGLNIKAWIFRILRNAYLTSRAGLAAKRTVALDRELSESGESGPAQYPEAAIGGQTSETDLLQPADRTALSAAMEPLPTPLQEVILLCDVEEMKYREMTGAAGTPIGTVMSRIARTCFAPDAALETQHVSSREFRS
jgi:RNA polymerase sigma-70 factor (ECF subfamily)